ncbi:Uncharacterised protein [Candidatus Bilamarchaeum dharawalense]|uniref:YhhN-like protein n=1 Tax=Candidatus Bilamarchaeum dharawalense TaxID=2885759 RepID=A0A5E4LQ88_9ARCH|nr:Uncharacterised protein [Candidatus Bilamarchaeum dharawalense]
MIPKKSSQKYSSIIFYVGLVAMGILIAGVLSEPASLLQKILFFLGALGLTVVAHGNKQLMLFVLQIIICLGSILAFLDIGDMVKYAILLGAGIFVIGHVVMTKKYKKDRWGPICIVGLMLIAAGMATNAATYPLYFGLFLAMGSILVAFYSFMDYVYNKDKIAIIWLILNLIFAINPILLVISIVK